MTEHVRAGFAPVPCQRSSHGRCRTCELIDRDSPHYREDYRRAFHPEEFPDVPSPAPARLVNLGAPGLPQAPAPAPARPRGPSGLRKAANFGKAIVAHVVAGLPATDEATVAARLATCRACHLYAPEAGTCLHQGCGCVLEIKVGWADQKCPVGKW